METDKKNIIIDKTFNFALRIISFSELLEQNKKNVLAKQLLRAGMSIGANVREAQNAESKNDFIHKMKIAAKEAGETEYFLLLCKHSNSYPFSDSLLTEISDIIKIISKIISSSKKQ